MSTQLLGSMDDAALRRYFERNVRYSGQMPAGAQYFIRIGSVSICSSDTADLWSEFEKAVKLIKEKTMAKKAATHVKDGAPVTEKGLELMETVTPPEAEVFGKYAAPWKPGPTECFNKECGRDLRQINPTYTLREKPDVAWCSQACRATYTKEEVRSKPAPRPVDAGVTPEPAAAAKGKKPGVLPSAPRREREALAAKAAAPKASKQAGPGRASSSPWSNLDGKLHLTGKTPPNFQGNRKAVWEMIKNGITVRALYEACDKAGLDGKSNLAKIIGVYGCAEVK